MNAGICTRAAGGIRVIALSSLLLTSSALAAPFQVAYDGAPVAAQSPGLATYAPVIEKASPSVVNIFTVKKIVLEDAPIRLKQSGWSASDLLKKLGRGNTESADDEVGHSTVTRSEERISSGVIVSEDGFIITNFHVVDGADKIKVSLADGSEYTPKVVGGDPATDLAILKIPAKKLQPVTFTDSDQLKVGDVAFTLGNPYGIGQTVSMGIISATGRGGFGILEYEDFIQTDASINPGNSGGALIDAQGRLIGINTAIMSVGGSSQGIGFAIPANLVRTIAAQLATKGKVTRSYLGVFVLPLSPELIEALELPDVKGVFIGGVTPDSPAAKAGIKSGDILLAVNGKPARDCRRLQTTLAHAPLNEPIKFTLWSEGSERSLACAPTASPEKAATGKQGRTSDLASALQRLLQ